ncbi:Panacea domain-containing protein [Caldicellulosiruptor acetigenus]|uniref:Panacea domain-containing protein n=1 Tax=Caldicellulosiruptor acetigenus TaxID=301953 RepID=UPI0001E9A2A5|nr:Panacea domain-containing protein [Caldicellulosiruptor acetigenus]
MSSLNKYLWYIDFLHFKRYSRFITGLSYIRYTYGPVIKGFVYNEIATYPSDKFSGEEYKTEDGAIKTSFKSRRNYDLSLLTQEELDTINTVINFLKDKSCRCISELSHQELAWQKTPMKELILYEYAKTLKLENS